jgi:hypothetical protein
MRRRPPSTAVAVLSDQIGAVIVQGSLLHRPDPIHERDFLLDRQLGRAGSACLTQGPAVNKYHTAVGQNLAS